MQIPTFWHFPSFFCCAPFPKSHSKFQCVAIYIYSDPEVDRIFFWRVRDLCWNYVGCWPLKNKLVVGIFRPSPGRSKTGCWNMVWRVDRIFLFKVAHSLKILHNYPYKKVRLHRMCRNSTPGPGKIRVHRLCFAFTGSNPRDSAKTLHSHHVFSTATAKLVQFCFLQSRHISKAFMSAPTVLPRHAGEKKGSFLYRK